MKKQGYYEKIIKIETKNNEVVHVYSNDPKLKKIQEVNLKMAQYFVDFCNENELLCYFCGGGAIGAIRHHGFIPWDDDLDFFMPRNDYEKLIQLWGKNKDERYVLVSANEQLNDRNSFTTIRDTQTTFIKTYQADLDLPHGIQLDIFPLDTAPDDLSERKKQKRWALIYALYRSQQVPQNHGSLLKIAGRMLLTLPAKTKYKIWRYAEKQMTKYNQQPTQNITELCVGPRYMGNVYPWKDFEKAKWVPFEDTQMPIPIGYDDYLKQAFGDYMELPPEEARVAHHEAVFLDPEQPYTLYRGKYYLKGE